MSYPTTLYLPTFLVRSFETSSASQYNVAVDFPPTNGTVAWKVGALVNGSSTHFVHTVDSSPPDPGSSHFILNGGPAPKVAFFISTTTTAGNRQEMTLNVGWSAAENSSRAGGILLRSGGGQGGQTPIYPGSTEPLTLTDEVVFPYIYRLNNWEGANRGWLTANINGPLQRGVVSCIFSEDGHLLYVFQGSAVSHSVTFPLNQQYYIASFLVPTDRGPQQVDFEIGDPRKDGAMTVTEIN